MKKIICICIACLLSICLITTTVFVVILADQKQDLKEKNQTLETEIAELKDLERRSEFIYSNVKAVAHRGYTLTAPENTLPAFTLAKQNGFRFVECDVSFTKDSIAVLLHDNTIDRTSNGTGQLSSLTLEEVRRFDFGAWKSEKYAGTKIPTFEEFIILCKELDLLPYIELKTGTKSQIQSLVAIVGNYGLMEGATWISANRYNLNYIKEANPTARLGYVVSSVTEDSVAVAQSLQSPDNQVFIDGHAPTAEEIALCQDAELPLEVYVYNGITNIPQMPPYVSGITVDLLSEQNYIHLITD